MKKIIVICAVAITSCTPTIHHVTARPNLPRVQAEYFIDGKVLYIYIPSDSLTFKLKR